MRGTQRFFCMHFKELTVYQKAIHFVTQVYQQTQDFPDHEKFGIISQIRRAACSIPANIAEGAQRQSRAEYVKFLYISFGSCAEVETFLEISFKLKYLSKESFDQFSAELATIGKMLNAMIKKLKV